MNNQVARIITGPHLLFTGQSGHKVYGITVQSMLTAEETKARGLRHTWDINDHTISRVDLSSLELSKAEANTLRNEIDELKMGPDLSPNSKH